LFLFSTFKARARRKCTWKTADVRQSCFHLQKKINVHQVKIEK